MKYYFVIICIGLALLCGSARGQTITLEWEVFDWGGEEATNGEFTLESSIGQMIVDTMSGEGLTLESGFMPASSELSGTSVYYGYEPSASWNLISLSVLPGDNTTTALFPTATSNAFRFNAGYIESDSLNFGEGYWLKFPNTDEVGIVGASVYNDTIEVHDKWNMIGSLSDALAKNQIIPLGTTIASACFQFSEVTGYSLADTLFPGKGYWMKVNGAGKLILQNEISSLLARNDESSPIENQSGNQRAIAASEGMKTLKTISFEDSYKRHRTLSYRTLTGTDDGMNTELPPLPPTGVMDVRFSTGRNMVEAEKEKMVETPISLTWAHPSQ